MPRPHRQRRRPRPGRPPAPVGPRGRWSPWPIPKKLLAQLQPVEYRAGSRLEGRVFNVGAWGRWSLPRRLDFLTALVKEWGTDPQLAEQAAHILQAAGVPGRAHRDAWAALLSWVQDNIDYRNEPGERIQSPQYTLEHGYGDCDDMAILLASLGHSLRMPWRFTVSGREKRNRRRRRRWVHRRGPIPPGVSWSHIYLSVGWPPFRPEVWTFAEPTLKVPLGWDVIRATRGRRRSVLPEMNGPPAALAGAVAAGRAPLALAGDFGAATPEVPNMAPSGVCMCPRTGPPAPSSPPAETPRAFRDPVGWVQTLPWREIIAGALPTVLSFYLIKKLGDSAPATAPKLSNPGRRGRRRRRRRR